MDYFLAVLNRWGFLGRANLPGVCPVCDHSPLNPDDCKVNTALRTTVAVFLRTAEKKHALSLQKEQKASQLQHNQQLQHLHQQAQPLEPTRIPEVKITQKILSDRPTITTSEKSPPLKSKSPNHVGDVEPLDEEKNDVFKADQVRFVLFVSHSENVVDLFHRKIFRMSREKKEKIRTLRQSVIIVPNRWATIRKTGDGSITKCRNRWEIQLNLHFQAKTCL
jgi:hypothetical protein